MSSLVVGSNQKMDTDNLNRLLKRQIKRYLKGVEITPEFTRFLNAVNDTYIHYEEDRRMLEHSMDLSSREMGVLNDQLRADAEQKELILTKLRTSVNSLFSIETSLSNAQFNDDKDVLGLISLIEDQSEKIKQADQKMQGLVDKLKNTNKELEDFAYIVSHDLKAPLRGISSLAMMISEEAEDVLDEDTQEMLTMMRERVGRMEALITGILRYSKLGSDQEEITEINTNQVVTEIVDYLSPPAHFEVHIDPELPVIHNEEVKIRQVFQNFISNAIKYNDKDAATISITSKLNGAFYEFCIADNGPGIPEKYHERIFKLFQTIGKPTTQNTGVGLTIVKKVIDKNKGKLWLESKVGEGTKFFFTLPKASK